MNDNINWPNDSQIISEFTSSMQDSLIPPDQYAQIQTMLNKYIKLLNKRKGLTNTSKQIEIKANNEIKQQKTLIKMLKSQLSSLQYDRENIHKEFIKLVHLQKQTHQKFKSQQTEIDVERKKLIQQRIQLTLKKKVVQFQKLRKSKGEKAVLDFKDTQARRLKLEFQKRQKQVRDKLEDLYSTCGYWDTQIQQAQNTVQKSVLQDLNDQIETIEKQIYNLKDQKNIIQQAQDQLQAKLQGFIASKKKELKKDFWTGNSNNDFGKIDELQFNKARIQDDIEDLQRQQSKMMEKFNSQIEQLEIQESTSRTKLLQTQNRIKSLANNRNKAQNLQQKLKELEKQMKEVGMNINGESPDNIESKPSFHQNVVVESIDQSEPDQDDSYQLRSQARHAGINPKFLQFDIGRIVSDQANIMSPTSFESGLNWGTLAAQYQKYTFDLQDSSPAEKKFFKAIYALLTGSQLWKKFSQRNSLKLPEFDPILAYKIPVETCGFGLRFVSLDESLQKLEIRQLNKKIVESRILVKDIKAPIIPRHTMEIIKAQKKDWLMNQSDDDPYHQEVYLEMKALGTIVYQDNSFQIKSKQAKHYPFFIQLENGGRIEMIPDEYIVFRQWMEGLNSLVKFKKQLPLLKHKVLPL